MASVRDTGKHRPTEFHEFAGRGSVVETPDRECDVDVVYDRSSREHRGASERDTKTSRDEVTHIFSRRRTHIIGTQTRNAQCKALIWTLRPEACSGWLQSIDLGGAITSPRIRDDIG